MLTKQVKVLFAKYLNKNLHTFLILKSNFLTFTEFDSRSAEQKKGVQNEMSKANVSKASTFNSKQEPALVDKDSNPKVDSLTDQDYFVEELLSLEESIDRTWQEFEDQRASINEGYRKLEKITKASNSFKKQYKILLSFYESHLKGQNITDEKNQPTDLAELQEKQIQECVFFSNKQKKK
ncbi:hypothetical protein RFI_27528 [Reticulomyxa filosa]|uniref:Uncharacterized protein n=1 Tax=Reticulomyxa filosa TaxID=46433 RepID=X6M7E1_RETFI|nr:hypothetical protein RFI_27528 [Reticulomyxa filosa]|eukprot:ETO09849.1 hypothetical protein RFI_27528 [Reticulomyxa filosa]